MRSSSVIALQINMYPPDVRHIEALLPHQVSVWGDQVDQIDVHIDIDQSRSGRYHGSDYEACLKHLRALYKPLEARFPKLRFHEIDTHPDHVRKVAHYFFSQEDMPLKAWDGGGFYSYFYGLYHSHADYIFHIDSDMFFGGDAQNWIDKALKLFETHHDLAFICPLPGPPREDGKLFGHKGIENAQLSTYSLGQNESVAAFSTVSTRVFFVDMNRLKEKIFPLPLLEPSALKKFKSFLLGHDPRAREAETILSHALGQTGLKRICYGGDMRVQNPVWSLHPPYRSALFYKKLTELIQRIEKGDMPEDQKGHYNIQDCLFDWSDVRASYSRKARLLKQLRHMKNYWLS